MNAVSQSLVCDIAGALLDAISGEKVGNVNTVRQVSSQNGYVRQVPSQNTYVRQVSSVDAYRNGYEEGYINGYKAGYTEGLKDGIMEANKEQF